MISNEFVLVVKKAYLVYASVTAMRHKDEHNLHTILLVSILNLAPHTRHLNKNSRDQRIFNIQRCCNAGCAIINIIHGIDQWS